MPMKNGKPNASERRILAKIEAHGGVVMLTKDEDGSHYTTKNGRRVAQNDTILCMIANNLLVPMQDGLFPDSPAQTYVPREGLAR